MCGWCVFAASGKQPWLPNQKWLRATVCSRLRITQPLCVWWGGDGAGQILRAKIGSQVCELIARGLLAAMFAKAPKDEGRGGGWGNGILHNFQAEACFADADLATQGASVLHCGGEPTTVGNG